MDQGSLDRAQSMMDGQWDQEGMISSNPTNYVAFIYDSDEAGDLGISFSVKNEQRFAPVNESYFTVKKDNQGKWEFRLEETIDTLVRFSRGGLPVRLLGVPSFIFDLVVELKSVLIMAGSIILLRNAKRSLGNLHGLKMPLLPTLP